jgi:hypothetical protein
METIKIIRRVSGNPSDLGCSKILFGICPDVFETNTGDFLIIGRDVTSIIEPEIPADSLISKGERVVLIPREVFVSAADNVVSE